MRLVINFQITPTHTHTKPFELYEEVENKKI